MTVLVVVNIIIFCIILAMWFTLYSEEVRDTSPEGRGGNFKLLTGIGAAQNTAKVIIILLFIKIFLSYTFVPILQAFAILAYGPKSMPERVGDAFINWPLSYPKATTALTILAPGSMLGTAEKSVFACLGLILGLFLFAEAPLGGLGGWTADTDAQGVAGTDAQGT